MKNAVSLFASSGIGDLGLEKNGINVIVANELLPERAALFSNNFPNTKMIIGDIWEKEKEIINSYYSSVEEPPFVLMATPPCQGMSPNGMGKMLSDYRKGLRDKFDPRNQLIIPTINIAVALQPKWIVFENVPNMENTIILDENDNPINIIDYIFKRLDNYVGKAEVVNTADYGIPQIRKRLITILTRTDEGKELFNSYKSFLPPATHSSSPNVLEKTWITLRDAIGSLPVLDAVEGKNEAIWYHPLHRVSILDKKKHLWISNTNEGDSAFNNQCINPNCRYQENPRHGSKRVNGINKYNEDTPLYCEKCGQLLPRPYVEEKDGTLRTMKGYVSAYKRMSYDWPASTLTMNFPYVSSDNKVHPTQNRPLSIYEALVIQTISDYKYEFKVNNQFVTDNTIIESIGESVPPKLVDIIIQKIINIKKK